MTREELENSTIKELIEAGEIPFSSSRSLF